MNHQSVNIYGLTDTNKLYVLKTPNNNKNDERNSNLIYDKSEVFMWSC